MLNSHSFVDLQAHQKGDRVHGSVDLNTQNTNCGSSGHRDQEKEQKSRGIMDLQAHEKSNGSHMSVDLNTQNGFHGSVDLNKQSTNCGSSVHGSQKKERKLFSIGDLRAHQEDNGLHESKDLNK